MIKLIKSSFYKEKETKKKLLKFIETSQSFSFGHQCDLFERRFSSWQGRKHCIMLNSGSSANLAIVQALLNLGRLKKGDNVGFSALTWSTNVMPLIELGLTAIPIDIDLSTLNVSSEKLEDVLKTKKIKMLFLTNLLGWCHDIDQIAKICKKNNIIFIEDNCESMGTVFKGKLLGNWSLASTFSYYVGHHMSTIEGGSVCTDDDELATMLRLVRAHGWDRNLGFAKQHEIRNKFKVNSTFYSRYTFYDLGYNLRPTEIAGFLGSVQLRYANEIIRKRQRNFLEMAKPIYARIDRYYPLKYDHFDTFSNFAIPIICRSEKIRNDLVKKCRDVIEIRPVVGGDMTQQPFFISHVHVQKELKTKNASLVHEQGLYFGNNPELTDKEKKLIIKIFTS